MSWQRKKLEDIANFTLGKMLDEKKNKGELLPYLANINVRWGSFDLDELREMKFEEHEKDRFGLKEGDIVMCEGGEPGRCAIWKDQNPNMMIQKALHRIRPYEDVDGRFLFYSFLHKGKAGGFAPLFTGSTIKHFPKEKLAKIEVDIPPLQTQQQIASILSNYDDLIENNRRRIQLLEESARLLYKEWFVQLRFPGHEHVKITDGVPEGWEKSVVADLGEVVTGKTPSTKDEDNFGNDVPFIKTPDLHTSSVVVFPEEYLSDKGAKTQPNKFLPPYSILVACIGAKLGVVSFNRYVAQTNQQINAVIPKEDYLRYFSYFLLKSFEPRLQAIGGGATMPNVNKSKFSSLNFILPDKNILVLFNGYAQSSFDQMALLIEMNKKLEEARDILLPRLMNGALAA